MNTDVSDDTTKAEHSHEMLRMLADRQMMKEQRLTKLGEAVGKKRDAAVKARQVSGIERIWTEDAEYYEGIDDSNRANSEYTKSLSANGGLTSSASAGSKEENGECTAFFNAIRQFVDSASARLGDILLPATDWNFAIKATPIVDMDKIRGSVQQVVDGDNTPVNNPDGTPHTLGQFAAKEEIDAEDKVKKAETKIKDYLVECQYKSEVRKVIEDAAKIGTGIIRGAYPVRRKSKAVIDDALVVEYKISPSSKRVDPFNFFPDGNCGENIHDGSHVLEREYLSAGQLRELAESPSYHAKGIKKVLEEGANKKYADGRLEQATQDDDRFEVWYYYGEIEAEDLIACGCKEFDNEDDNSMKFAHAVVVLVNDTVIKGYMNPNTSGEFPYDVMPWQARAGSPFGIGVARQGRVAQDMLNASARALMKNTSLSSAPQIILKQGVIMPADGNYNMYGGKTWVAVEDEGVDKVADAIQIVNIPSNQGELVNLINLASKMMEDATGVTFLLQGQQGSAPDTVGGMELLHKNASALLRRIARIFDERITEPHIRRYYEWILIHGEDDEKGDMQIEAIGSSALVEREIQSMQAAQILQMSLNPAFGYSPKKAADEVLKSWKFNPKSFELSEEEKQQAQQAQQQVPPMPQVEVAKINTQSREKIADMQMQSNERKMVEDLDRDEAYQETMKERSAQDFQAKREELRLRRELAIMDYANKNELKLADVKSQLANTAMKLRTQKELTNMDGKAPQVVTPAVEPVGRAPDGEAFTK